jgi:ribosomal protein S18 acetylase RimI-like enzyme
MLVRNLLLKEKEQVLELGKKIFREEDEIPLLRKALSLCSTDLSLVVIDKTNIVGFSLVCSKTPTNYYAEFMKKIPNCYELAFLGIDPYAQGKGLGSLLIKETFLRTAQISNKPFTYWLLVDTINEGAIKLYEKIGFRQWCKVQQTLLPGYIMGIHSRRMFKTSYPLYHYQLPYKKSIKLISC